MEVKDFWYVVAESRQLKPKQVIFRKLLGEWLAIFRDEGGNPAALQDRCKHRAAQLSKGYIRDGCVVCPYHGWTYDRRGEVVAVPSEGENFKRSATRRTTAYSVLERDDYVYVRMNDGDTAQEEPFRMRHYGEKGWHTIRLINRFRNTVTNCVENFIDIPHTIFVHPGIFRNERRQKIDVEIKRENGSVKASYKNEDTNIGFTSKFLNPSGHEIVHTDEFFMPNVSCVEYVFGPRRHFIITSQSIPLEDDETLVYTDLTYNYRFWNKLVAPAVWWMGQTIINQDIVALNNQMEVIKKYGSNFANTPADTIHAFVETIQRELQRGNDPNALPAKSVQVVMYV